MAYEIVIAGGEPVALFLACELGLAGTLVVVLERMEDPRSPLKEGWIGMCGLTFPSVGAFYPRGVLKDIRELSLVWKNPASSGFDLRSETSTSAPLLPAAKKPFTPQGNGGTPGT